MLPFPCPSLFTCLPNSPLFNPFLLSATQATDSSEMAQQCWVLLRLFALTLCQGHMQCCLNNLAWHKSSNVLVSIFSPSSSFLPLLGLKLPNLTNQGSKLKPVINIYFLSGILIQHKVTPRIFIIIIPKVHQM